MTKLYLWTRIIVGVAVLVLIVWDIYVAATGDNDSTISVQLGWILGRAHPAIPLFLGGLMSHLYWNGKTVGKKWIRCIIGAAILGAAIWAGFVFTLNIPGVIPLAFGFCLGRLLVPMDMDQHQKMA